MGADAAAAEVRAALEHAGARFMAMFDDAVEGAERASSRASPSAPRPRARRRRPRARTDEERRLPRAPLENARARGGRRVRGVPPPRARGPAAAAAADANANANANASAPASAQPPAAVPVVVFGGDRPTAAASRGGADSRGVSSSRGAGDVPVARAKRLFMSERISRVHEDPAPPTTRPGRSDRDDRASPPNAIVPGLTGASLNDMRGKVAALGARGLDKWSRRALDARRLRSLGAKPEKAPRTPANVGVGAWRANEAREEARRMEAFEAGGRLMKKRREDASGAAVVRGRGGGDGDRDRGLAWGQGNFKGGVLTLSRRDVESKPDRRVATSDAYLAGTRLSGADGGGGRRGGRGKGGGKGGRPQGGKKKHGGKGGKRR